MPANYKSYLISPKYVLGSDSFRVAATSHLEAIKIAKKRIKNEDWHSPHGWEVMLEITTFEED